jgi:pyridinium-3,5-bisthiocarboxylic acid mononucleotide nickel chelatase
MMKKGRPAATVHALCPDDRAPAVRRALFTETSTIGLRETRVAKHALGRRVSTVEVEGHPIRIKTAYLDGEPVNTSVEYDDVVAVAAALGLAPKAVLARATAAAVQIAAKNVSEPAS